MRPGSFAASQDFCFHIVSTLRKLFILLDTTSELLYFSPAFGVHHSPDSVFKIQTRHLLADRFQLSAVTAKVPKQFVAVCLAAFRSLGFVPAMSK
jgi:hypothetical protein